MYTLHGEPRRMSIKDNENGTLTQTILVLMQDGNGFTKSEISKFDFVSDDTYKQQNEKAMIAANSVVSKYNK